MAENLITLTKTHWLELSKTFHYSTDLRENSSESFQALTIYFYEFKIGSSWAICRHMPFNNTCIG